MAEDEGLIYAARLDGAGGGEALDWEGVRAWRPGHGALWLHLNRHAADAQRWLAEESGLGALVVEALLAEETRPRCQPIGEGLLLILRGVNLNPGADPDDMVSLRLWIEAERIVSVRLRRLMAVDDLRRALAEGHGPAGVADFVPALAGRLTERMGPVLQDIDDEIDAMEEEVLAASSFELRTRLHRTRHKAITLRRYVAPQREALGRLLTEPPGFLAGLDRGRLREIADRVMRYVEDLDAARERAAVVQDELANRLAEQMNRTMYMLAIVATIFLPLGFVTGLLGINVAGMPGADTPWAFAAVVGLLALLAAFEIWLFRRLRWL